jgi:hypothetical protein
MRDDLQHMRDKATELELKMDRVGRAGQSGTEAPRGAS